MEHLKREEQIAKGMKVFSESFKSKFYSNKYSELKNIKSHDIWEKIPILNREEIYANSFPRSQDMLTCDVKDMIIISTGGSSGVARYTTFTHSEWDDFAIIQADAMRVLGINSDDKVANLFIAGHFWPSFLGLHEVIKKLGAVHLPISSNIPPEDIVKLCLEFEPTIMISLPTLFVFLADMAQRDGFEFKNLRMIQYVGEHLSSQAEAHIKKHLNVKEIKSGAYSSADAGIMGYQCNHCPPGVYHIPTGFQFIEVINFETGKYAEPNEIGEVVVTNLKRTSTPIIRYRVGDAVSLTGEECKCGDKNPLLKLAGRSGQDFKIGGGFISMQAIETSIGEFSDYFSLNYQLVLNDNENKLEINLNIETVNEPSFEQVDKLQNKLFENIKEFKIGTSLGYISIFKINPVKLGSLPRSPITGKVKKLDDKRVK
jgi:phenylacetate-CoA ligase